MKKYRDDVRALVFGITGGVMFISVIAKFITRVGDWSIGIMFFVFVALIVAVILLGYFWGEMKLPIAPKETQEEMEEMESWLYGQGYRRYCGSVSYTSDMIIFDKKKAFPSFQSGWQRKSYEFWDMGEFRIVKSTKPESQRRYYIK